MVAVDVEITEGTRLMAMAVKACVEAEAVMMAVVLRAMIMVMMVKAKIQVNAGVEERWRWRVRKALVMVAMLMAEVKARVRAAVVNRIAMHAMAVIVAAVEMAWKMAVMRETLIWTEMTVA